MKAIVYDTYGPPEVLRVTELERPTPREDEVLVAVRATTVNTGDWRVRSLELPPGFGVFGRLAFGVSRPRQPILGAELSGSIVAIGARVTRFAVGDDVFAFTGAKMGCYVQYKCLREDGPLVKKPASLSFEQAAALSFGGTTALDFLRRGDVKKGEEVLVNGASGTVGSAFVQLAKHLGARVTAVCGPTNAALVASLGADRVLDYTREDFTKEGKRYDVIIDTAGTAPYSRSRVALNDGGRLLVVLGGLGDLLRGPLVAMTTKHRVVGGSGSERVEDLRELAALAEAGVFKPLIDRAFAFEQIVEAHRYVDKGHKRGSVVIPVPQAS